MPIPIIIDCDTGIDDSLALLYACASPDAEIVAVTCVGGNVDARQVAENTRAVLELAGRPDVEVALGREQPLVRPLRTTPETHGPRGIGYAQLPPASRPLSKRHAADLLIEEARRRPGEITLVAIGPLTNHRRRCSARTRTAASPETAGDHGRRVSLDRATPRPRPNGTSRSIPDAAQGRLHRVGACADGRPSDRPGSRRHRDAPSSRPST